MNCSFYWPLFEHMTKEHGLTLTESELEEIRLIANTMKRPADNEMDQAKGEMSEPITISEEARKAAEAELNAAYTRRHIAAHEENEKGFACQIAINSATSPLQKRIEELQSNLTTYEGRTNFCCECGGSISRKYVKREVLEKCVNVLEGAEVCFKYPRGSEAQIRCLEEVYQDSAHTLTIARKELEK